MFSGRAQKMDPLLVHLAFNFHDPAKKSNWGTPEKLPSSRPSPGGKRVGMKAGLNPAEHRRGFFVGKTTAAARQLPWMAPQGGLGFLLLAVCWKCQNEFKRRGAEVGEGMKAIKFNRPDFSNIYQRSSACITQRWAE
jgi:hypothetical protein